MHPRFHAYARAFAAVLAPLTEPPGPARVLEVGTLGGTGLALWSRVFPRAEILGLTNPRNPRPKSAIPGRETLWMAPYAVVLFNLID